MHWVYHHTQLTRCMEVVPFAWKGGQGRRGELCMLAKPRVRLQPSFWMVSAAAHSTPDYGLGTCSAPVYMSCTPSASLGARILSLCPAALMMQACCWWWWWLQSPADAHGVHALLPSTRGGHVTGRLHRGDRHVGLRLCVRGAAAAGGVDWQGHNAPAAGGEGTAQHDAQVALLCVPVW